MQQQDRLSKILQAKFLEPKQLHTTQSQQQINHIGQSKYSIASPNSSLHQLLKVDKNEYGSLPNCTKHESKKAKYYINHDSQNKFCKFCAIEFMNSSLGQHQEKQFEKKNIAFEFASSNKVQERKHKFNLLIEQIKKLLSTLTGAKSLQKPDIQQELLVQMLEVSVQSFINSIYKLKSQIIIEIDEFIFEQTNQSINYNQSLYKHEKELNCLNQDINSLQSRFFSETDDLSYNTAFNHYQQKIKHIVSSIEQDHKEQKPIPQFKCIPDKEFLIQSFNTFVDSLHKIEISINSSLKSTQPFNNGIINLEDFSSLIRTESIQKINSNLQKASIIKNSCSNMQGSNNSQSQASIVEYPIEDLVNANANIMNYNSQKQLQSFNLQQVNSSENYKLILNVPKSISNNNFEYNFEQKQKEYPIVKPISSSIMDKIAQQKAYKEFNLNSQQTDNQIPIYEIYEQRRQQYHQKTKKLRSEFQLKEDNFQQKKLSPDVKQTKSQRDIQIDYIQKNIQSLQVSKSKKQIHSQQFITSSLQNQKQKSGHRPNQSEKLYTLLKSMSPKTQQEMKKLEKTEKVLTSIPKSSKLSNYIGLLSQPSMSKQLDKQMLQKLIGQKKLH